MASKHGRADEVGAQNTDVAHAEALFIRELATIERAIRFACRRGGVQTDEVDDFASSVKLKLIDDGYAIIRKYEGRSSFAAFISVVVQRLLLDYRIAQWGKWHASAQARRLGEPAITIEAMLVRDGRTIDEILPALTRRWPDLTLATIEALSRQLPRRANRPRVVNIDPPQDLMQSGWDGVDDVILASDRRELSGRIEAIVRATMCGLEESDRLIFRLRFEAGMSVADISRILGLEQKPLYRRLARGLASLRTRLEASGITAADAAEVLASRHGDLDFGFLPSNGSGPTYEEDL